MSGRINRITLFKCPDPEMQKKLLAAYEELASTQSKDGKPYILYMSAGIAYDDARSQGYNIVSKTEFATLDDMKYFDDGCAAHGKLRQLAMGLGLTEKPMTIYFAGEPQLMTPHK